MNICRTKFKDQIVTEFVPPRDTSSRRVMIFCSGVPGHPDKDEVLDFWARKGYWAFFPRFRGSWESTGEFLQYSLEQDVLNVIDCLPEKFEDYWTHKKYRVNPNHITVVGSSFGGPAAILATLDKRVNKAVCISPVVDWRAEHKHEPLDILYDILRDVYPGAYRVHKKNWDKLLTGRFYNPANRIPQIDGRKILIFHAKDDTVVRFKPVEEFAAQTGARLVTLNRGGHLSSSMLMGFRYSLMVDNFLRSE